MVSTSILIALGAGSCRTAGPGPCASADLDPAATGTAADGRIAALRLLFTTPTSEYFALSYWSDGLLVRGFLGRPRGAARKLPAVIWNRGGNRHFAELDPRWLVPYVEAGFVAVGSQYRGGVGSEGKDEFGGADVDDVLNLIPLLLRLPEVDPARLAMVGYSRGGVMTYLALREEARRGRGRIRAAATVGGAAELPSPEDRPDMVPVYEATIGCLPTQCPAEYRRRSAVNWPEELRTPLLLLHGEEDARVPVATSRRMAAGLANAGREVKLVILPGDDHSLTGHGYGLPEILDWFEAHLDLPRGGIRWELVARRTVEVLESWPPRDTPLPEQHK